MEIREYTDLDYNDCVKLLENSFPEISKVFDEVGCGLNNINKSCNKQLVATISNKIVGYLLITKNYDPVIDRYNFYIDYFCVLDKYRNNGIGRKMLLVVEELAMKENIYMINFSSSRFRVAARKLYLDMGYIIRESDLFRKVI